SVQLPAKLHRNLKPMPSHQQPISFSDTEFSRSTFPVLGLHKQDIRQACLLRVFALKYDLLPSEFQIVVIVFCCNLMELHSKKYFLVYSPGVLYRFVPAIPFAVQLEQSKTEYNGNNIPDIFPPETDYPTV